MRLQLASDPHNSWSLRPISDGDFASAAKIRSSAELIKSNPSNVIDVLREVTKLLSSLANYQLLFHRQLLVFGDPICR